MSNNAQKDESLAPELKVCFASFRESSEQVPTRLLPLLTRYADETMFTYDNVARSWVLPPQVLETAMDEVHDIFFNNAPRRRVMEYTDVVSALHATPEISVYSRTYEVEELALAGIFDSDGLQLVGIYEDNLYGDDRDYVIAYSATDESKTAFKVINLDEVPRDVRSSVLNTFIYNDLVANLTTRFEAAVAAHELNPVADLHPFVSAVYKLPIGTALKQLNYVFGALHVEDAYWQLGDFLELAKIVTRPFARYDELVDMLTHNASCPNSTEEQQIRTANALTAMKYLKGGKYAYVPLPGALEHLVTRQDLEESWKIRRPRHRSAATLLRVNELMVELLRDPLDQSALDKQVLRFRQWHEDSLKRQHIVESFGISPEEVQDLDNMAHEIAVFAGEYNPEDDFKPAATVPEFTLDGLVAAENELVDLVLAKLETDPTSNLSVEESLAWEEARARLAEKAALNAESPLPRSVGVFTYEEHVFQFLKFLLLLEKKHNIAIDPNFKVIAALSYYSPRTSANIFGTAHDRESK